MTIVGIEGAGDIAGREHVYAPGHATGQEQRESMRGKNDISRIACDMAAYVALKIEFELFDCSRTKFTLSRYSSRINLAILSSKLE